MISYKEKLFFPTKQQVQVETSHVADHEKPADTGGTYFTMVSETVLALEISLRPNCIYSFAVRMSEAMARTHHYLAGREQLLVLCPGPLQISPLRSPYVSTSCLRDLIPSFWVTTSFTSIERQQLA